MAEQGRSQRPRAGMSGRANDAPDRDLSDAISALARRHQALITEVTAVWDELQRLTQRARNLSVSPLRWRPAHVAERYGWPQAARTGSPDSTTALRRVTPRSRGVRAAYREHLNESRWWIPRARRWWSLPLAGVAALIVAVVLFLSGDDEAGPVQRGEPLGALAPAAAVAPAAAETPPRSPDPSIAAEPAPPTDAGIGLDSQPTGAAAVIHPPPAIWTVRPGDTLGGIALRTGASVEALVALNDLRDPDLIHVGQELLLPERSAPADPVVFPAASP